MGDTVITTNGPDLAHPVPDHQPRPRLAAPGLLPRLALLLAIATPVACRSRGDPYHPVGRDGNVRFRDAVRGRFFYVSADDLPGGGESPIRRILLRDGDRERTFLEIVQAETVERGLEPPRTDLRFATGPEGRLFLLNKPDGVIREIAP